MGEVHKFILNSSSLPSQKKSTVLIAVLVLLIVLGVATGFGLSKLGTGVLSPAYTGGDKPILQEVKGEVKKGQVYGSADEKAFRDSTEGTLEKGGLEDEGSHKLVRPGGESQTAYLTSSTLELDRFIGRKVIVWGETYKAAKAGWFMDVGRLEVLD